MRTNVLTAGIMIIIIIGQEGMAWGLKGERGLYIIPPEIGANVQMRLNRGQGLHRGVSCYSNQVITVV